MKERFVDRKFGVDSLATISQANSIIANYQAQGFTLTLRQLYYQFVSRALIANNVQSYKRLGSIINDARLAGMVDWSAIEDRTRNLEPINTWGSPSEILQAVGSQYKEDLWVGQPHRVEVWVEKEALVGVIETICEEKRVAYIACRGYLSQSEAYSAGKRLRGYRRSGQTPTILHLGDHDPSGIDMTRDNETRLEMFADGIIDMRRLALNMNQVIHYNPPPNPAKATDARFTDYQNKFGDDSWELDALDPQVIVDLIRNEIDSLIDPAVWQIRLDHEEDQKKRLEDVADRWEDVSQWLEDGN